MEAYKLHYTLLKCLKVIDYQDFQQACEGNSCLGILTQLFMEMTENNTLLQIFIDFREVVCIIHDKEEHLDIVESCRDHHT